MYIQHFPTASAGLGLSIITLGWCLDNFLNVDGIIHLSSAFITISICMVLLIKFILLPQKLLMELKDPLKGSLLPTFTMSLMACSFVLGHYLELSTLQRIVWYSSILIHFCFMVGFIFYQAQNFQLKKMLPSWFVPPVGGIVACIVNPGSDTLWLSEIILTVGIVSYLLLLPIMLYRLTFYRLPVKSQRPSITIMAAPPNLCIVGYLSITTEPAFIALLMLTGIAILFTLFTYLSLFSLLKLRFSTAYAAFTFPVAISTTAVFQVAEILNEFPIRSFLNHLAIVQMLLSMLIILYVLFGFIKNYRKFS